jgi:hypothetical protein
MSANDIEKGTRWRAGLASELESTSVSIICLTPENLESPWIHFEAGALSKQQQNSHVCTLLFGVEPIDIREPLSQFQATKAQQEDIRKLIQTINRIQGDDALSESKLIGAFDVWWPKLDQRLNEIPDSENVPDHKRDIKEILEEILELSRFQVNNNKKVLSAFKSSSRLPSTLTWSSDDAQLLYDSYQMLLKNLEEAKTKQEPQEKIEKLERNLEELCTSEKAAAEWLGVLRLGQTVMSLIKKTAKKSNNEELPHENSDS